jgi:DNA-binding NarL/FixJ family response regulator
VERVVQFDDAPRVPEKSGASPLSNWQRDETREGRYSKVRQVGAMQMSVRELALISYLAKGLTSKEIAEDAALSKATVDLGIRVLCDKLGARSRAQLVAKAIHSGYLSQ